jgi:hypothetical protein
MFWLARSSPFSDLSLLLLHSSACFSCFGLSRTAKKKTLKLLVFYCLFMLTVVDDCFVNDVRRHFNAQNQANSSSMTDGGEKHINI